MEYFLDLQTLKIEKEYTKNLDDLNHLTISIDPVVYDLPYAKGVSALVELFQGLGDISGSLLLDVETGLDFVDSYSADMLIHYIVEGITSTSENLEFRDYLAIPHAVEGQIIGIQKDIVKLVNAKTKLNRLQIRLVETNLEEGLKFVERII